MKTLMVCALAFLLVSLTSAPGQSESEGMSKGMLAEHNKVRATYKVPKLVWSDELAAYAQVWVDHLKAKEGCKPAHRPRQGAFAQKYGENIFWASAKIWSDGQREAQDTRPADVVGSWAAEVKDYDYETNTCKGVCGHYTQVVWKISKKVGCAKAVCDDKSQVWVCNYDPPGNKVGHKPY